jgi:hypothetical protein
MDWNDKLQFILHAVMRLITEVHLKICEKYERMYRSKTESTDRGEVRLYSYILSCDYFLACTVPLAYILLFYAFFSPHTLSKYMMKLWPSIYMFHDLNKLEYCTKMKLGVGLHYWYQNLLYKFYFNAYCSKLCLYI